MALLLPFPFPCTLSLLSQLDTRAPDCEKKRQEQLQGCEKKKKKKKEISLSHRCAIRAFGTRVVHVILRPRVSMIVSTIFPDTDTGGEGAGSCRKRRGWAMGHGHSGFPFG